MGSSVQKTANGEEKPRGPGLVPGSVLESPRQKDNQIAEFKTVQFLTLLTEFQTTPHFHQLLMLIYLYLKWPDLSEFLQPYQIKRR